MITFYEYPSQPTTKTAAIDWAQHLVGLDDYMILDFETTNMHDPKRGQYAEPCQLGLMNKSGTFKISTYIKPQNPILPGAEAVHKISNEAVKNAPTWADLYPMLKKLLHEQIVVAYNAGFEKPVLDHVTDLYKLERIKPRYTCAMLAYAVFNGEAGKYGGFKWKKLTDACRRFNLSVEGAHDAISDCFLTQKLIEAMASDGKEDIIKV